MRVLPGQYFDSETGLSYNYFRDYDPSIGRYIESDPIGLAAGLNTYTYVEGTPLSSVDASGLAGRKPSFIYAGCSDTQIVNCVEKCRAKGQIYQDCTQTYVKTPGVKPPVRFIAYNCVCKDKSDDKPLCGENCKKIWATTRDAAGVAIGFALICVAAAAAMSQ